MAISTDDLLGLARELAEYDGEVYWRSAVSRAYYCAYHECHALAVHLPDAPYAAEPKGVHDRVIKQFTTSVGNAQNARKLRAIGYVLASMKELRTTADYDIADEFPKAKASEALQYVESLRKKLQELEELADENTRTKQCT